MHQLEAVDSAVDVDLGSVAVEFGQSGGRLLVVLIATIAMMRLTRRAIGRVDDSRTREQLLFFAPKVAGVMSVITGLMLVGIDVSGMAAVLATIGFTGAVVFTPMGQNFVAGALIAMDDICRPGEVITVGERHGRVVYRSLLRTEIELPDDTKAWVPNSVFQDEEVLNHSRMGGWRVSVVVPLDRACDRLRAVDIMNDVLVDLPWCSAGKTPFVAFDEVAPASMMFTAFAWIDDRTQEPYYRGLLLSALVDDLEAAGISVGQTTNLSFADDTLMPVPHRRPASLVAGSGDDSGLFRRW